MVPKSPAPKRAGCLTAPHQAFSVQSFSASFRGNGPSQSEYPHGRRDRGALPAGGGSGVRQVPTHAIGLDAFQEVDTVGVTRPCVKHNMLVKDVRALASS